MHRDVQRHLPPAAGALSPPVGGSKVGVTVAVLSVASLAGGQSQRPYA